MVSPGVKSIQGVVVINLLVAPVFEQVKPVKLATSPLLFLISTPENQSIEQP